jgi:tRNA(Glu) U13 pseudouridine synthase TruD
MTLSFQLPKGSYATVLLKRLFHEAVTGDEEESD